MDEVENIKAESFSLETFVSKQYELLELERCTEIEENRCLQECMSIKDLVKKGICIPKLQYTNVSTGLFGRTMIKFQPFYSSAVFPTHVITSGDIVGVSNISSDGKIEVMVSGVVSHVAESSVTVAFEKNSEISELYDGSQYLIIKLANDVTYRRLKRILKTLESRGRDNHLVSVLFGEKCPSCIESSVLNDVSFNNTNLNDAQKEAVKFSLLQKEVTVLHGPPGTGKTTTVVECILQAISQGLKVLACAPSNVAVDNLVEKLALYKVKLIRLGHPARFLSNIQQYSLDSIVSRYDGSDVIEEMYKEVDKLRNKIGKTKGSHARKNMWTENKSLLKEIKEREKSIVKQVLKNVDVVLSTLTSASDDGPLKHVEKDHFDICVIDECSQALETACWIPLLLAKKCILAGDHNQLPPTILSEKAAKDGLSVTLMERLLKLHGDSIKRMLTVQYRMHEVIMHWPSIQLYEGKLKAHESVCSHLLSDLPNVEHNENTSIPLLLIDTAGCNLYELQDEEEESKGNEGEADIVRVHVENLIKSGVKASDIAIISPYNLQVDLLKSRLSGKYANMEIKSVDGFQGREKEVVIITLVRSNDEGDIGFLSEDRRINVAITRAKRHLAVVCNSETVSHSDFLKSFITYCTEYGEVRTAFQYESEIGCYPTPAKKQISGKKNEKVSVKNNVKEKAKKSSNTPVKSDKSNIQRDDRFSTEEKYQEIIQDFVLSNKTVFSFPPSLSAFERRIVHEIAEKFGLAHASTGEGEERKIEISKFINISTHSDNFNKYKNLLKDTETEAKETEKSSECIKVNTKDEKQASTELKEQIHKLQKPKIKKPSNLKTLKLNENKNADEEENFEELIAQVVKADKICRYQNCKKIVAVLAQVCQFCKGRFCFSHFIPEAHGCGDAVKAYARSQIRKEGVIYAGSGKPDKKLDPQKHSLLQKKLDKKINEMTKQRKSKPKS